MYATARDRPMRPRRTRVLVPHEAVTTRDGKRVVQKVQGDTVTASPVTEGLDRRHARADRHGPRRRRHGGRRRAARQSPPAPKSDGITVR